MSLPHPVAAVVFDMDGLLFDTEKLYAQAAMSAAKEIGCELSMEIFYRLVGTTLEENRRVLMQHYGDSWPFDDMRVAWGRHFKLLAATDLALKPGALELLDLLDELGVPRAIATSSSRETVRHHLLSHDIVGRFHEIVALGDYASSKPAPDPFLRAAERMKVDPRDCLALEDSPNGVRAAHAAGMMTVMVPDLIQPTVEIRALCTVVQSLLDVPALLRESRTGRLKSWR